MGFVNSCSDSPSDLVDALGSPGARIGRAHADPDPAVEPGEPIGALADPPINAVDTFGAVQTRLRFALVNVLVAQVSGEARRTDARSLRSFVYACRTVLAQSVVHHRNVACHKPHT